jgi:hypothetical protein
MLVTNSVSTAGFVPGGIALCSSVDCPTSVAAHRRRMARRRILTFFRRLD